jgi:3-deoxy-D-manno-octulosonic-acid transferase
MMLALYQTIMRVSQPLLNSVLEKRLKAGKEHPERIDERRGLTHTPRPDGRLIWVHAASVGEAQSSLILINRILKDDDDVHVLLTTGTLSSAALMAKNLPDRATHQFYPLDHPDWVGAFLDHWRPDTVLWMESELWPNMLAEIKRRNIPAALINARLSPASLKWWKTVKGTAARLLSAFTIILCQTETEAAAFKSLKHKNVKVTDNLKYSAKPLPVDYTANEDTVTLMRAHIQNRPCWVYASTHKGEEALAAQIHKFLKVKFPDVLTIIIPRHPERADDICEDLKDYGLTVQRRSTDNAAPNYDTDIYIADTFGELGLFYRAAPIACIGRSFSIDGGGGHNPIEAAQLGCAVLHGPNVQNLQDIFDEMDYHKVAMMMDDEGALAETLAELFTNTRALETMQNTALTFVQNKSGVLETIIDHLTPLIKAKS